MAPNGSRSRKTRRKASKPRRNGHKKKPVKPNNKSISNSKTSVLDDLHNSSSNSSSIISSDNLSRNINGAAIDDSESAVVEDEMMSATATSPCSTPKAQRFRIPEIQTCPPAPKKQRVLSNCSLQRTPIAFFAPPDIELFFLFSHRDISV